jgi:hypothetical protein
MTTVETAKLIRQDLAFNYPGIKFSVRKVHAGVIFVFHQIPDTKFTTELGQHLRKFEDWFKYQTEHVFEQRTN